MKSYSNPYISVVLFLLVSLLSLRCEHAGPLEAEIVPDDEAPTFASIQPILAQNCALSGCHLGPNALMGLDLSAENAYSNLVGIPSREVPSLQLVAANQPDESYLIMKLEGSPEMAAGTLLMPLGRSPLKEEEINYIRDWIEAGAENN